MLKEVNDYIELELGLYLVEKPKTFLDASVYLSKNEIYFKKEIFGKSQGFLQVKTKQSFGEVKLSISVKIKEFTYDFEVIYEGYADNFEFFKQLLKQIGLK
jgi:hypothetical protein